MRLIDAYQKLNSLSDAAILTRDAAGILAIEEAHASQLLSRMAKANLIKPVTKGLWAFPEKMDLFLLPRYLSAPFPSYISLYSALYSHNMIDQIPSVLYSVTLGRSKRFKTPLGEVSFHHLDPALFWGYEVDPITGIALATPEKALMDIFYFSSTKTKWFNNLVEVDLPNKFSLKKLSEMIKKIPSIRKRNHVQNRLKAWQENRKDK